MAYDAFRKIEGIDGESEDREHKGEIEIQSFSWGVTQTGSSSGGGGGGTGKAVLQDFHFKMPLSKASPSLMLACATGRHSPSAMLTCRKAGLEFLKVKLVDVLVSSYETDGDTSEEFPTDSLSLNFVKIDFIYTTKSGEVVEAQFTQV